MSAAGLWALVWICCGLGIVAGITAVDRAEGRITSRDVGCVAFLWPVIIPMLLVVGLVTLGARWLRSLRVAVNEAWDDWLDFAGGL